MGHAPSWSRMARPQGLARKGEPVGYEAIPRPTGLDRLRIPGKALRGDVTEVLSYVRERYGRTARLQLPGRDIDAIVICDPAHVEHVLETRQSNYRKSDEYIEQLGNRALGRGLLTSRGTAWRDQHRLMMPLFQRDSVFGFTDAVVEETERMLDRWRAVADRGGTIDLHEEMERVTLMVIGRAMFSTAMTEYADEVMAASDALRRRGERDRSLIPYPDWLVDSDGADPVATLRDIANRLMVDRRGREDEFDDLLTLMMTAGEDGEGLDQELIADNINTFLLAGHETTAVALTWTWFLLGNWPEVHRRLHDAVTDASPVTAATFTGDNIEAVRFARQTVQEAMRIYPPVPLFTREAVDDDVLGRYEVPGGTSLLISQFLTHRDPDIWEDPLAFRPERFHPDRHEERPRYSFYPFGGGARMCIGRQLSLIEAQVILSLAASEVRLKLESPAPGEDVGVSSTVTMVPDTAIEMSVHGWDR